MPGPYLYPKATEAKKFDSDLYEVLGADMQILHLNLAAGEQVTSEPGVMMYMEDGIDVQVGCNECCGRICSCNSCVMNTYTNKNEKAATIGLTPNIPAKVLPLEVDAGKSWKSKSGTYLAATGGASLGYDIDCNPCTACCAGMGCCRQKIFTKDESGVGYLKAMGTLTKKTLDAGETIVMDTNSLIAWEKTTRLGVRPTGCCCFCLCSGEGCCNTTVTGPGDVYIQSLSWEKFKKSMAVKVNKEGEDKSFGDDPMGAGLAMLAGGPETELLRPEAEAMER